MAAPIASMFQTCDPLLSGALDVCLQIDAGGSEEGNAGLGQFSHASINHLVAEFRNFLLCELAILCSSLEAFDNGLLELGDRLENGIVDLLLCLVDVGQLLVFTDLGAVHAIANIGRVYDERLHKHDFLT